MIVLDASTLILLAKTDLLDAFLNVRGGGVLIPAEVQAECCAKQTLDALLITKAIREKRIRVRTLTKRVVYEQLRADFRLATGEAAAIALAAAATGRIVGIDDQQGINACKLLTLPFVTAMGILLWLREQEQINEERALRALDALARHGRYKDNIIHDARSRLEGRP